MCKNSFAIEYRFYVAKSCLNIFPARIESILLTRDKITNIRIIHLINIEKRFNQSRLEINEKFFNSRDTFYNRR